MKKRIKYLKLKRKNKETAKTAQPQSFMPEKGFDKPLITALAGIIAIVPHILFTYLLKQMGLVMWDFTQIGAAVASNNQIKGGWQVYVVGSFQNAILGSLMGVLFYYSLYIVGKSQIYFKCIAFSAIVWMVARSVYLYLFNIPKEIFGKPISIFAYYTGMFTWGLLLAFLVNKYAFEKTPAPAKARYSLAFIPVPARQLNGRRCFRKPIKPRKI